LLTRSLTLIIAASFLESCSASGPRRPPLEQKARQVNRHSVVMDPKVLILSFHAACFRLGLCSDSAWLRDLNDSLKLSGPTMLSVACSKTVRPAFVLAFVSLLQEAWFWFPNGWLSQPTRQSLRHRGGSMELSPVPNRDTGPPVNLRICFQANRACRLDESLRTSRVSTAKQKGILAQYVGNESKSKSRAVGDVNPRSEACSGLQNVIWNPRIFDGNQTTS